MYIPGRHRLDDTAALHALIEAHPLGAWVCQGDSGWGGALVANHLPFLLDRGCGPQGRLLAHVARGNAVWRTLCAGAVSVVMFQGPQAYISPGWYPGKQAHGKVVPTWNYVVAHVHGRARVVDDPAALRAMLSRLTDTHEARRPQPWRLGDAPAAFIDAMQRGVVGIEIVIERIEGRLKASQDEDLADRHGTVQGLREDPVHACPAMAELVRRALADEPPGAG